jgi:hypothetical protein
LRPTCSPKIPPPFVIGFHGFGPEWNPNVFRQHYVRGYLSNPVTDFERYNFVGDTIFARTRELGATLISYPINAGFVIPTPNVTHQLSDVAHPPAHAQPLDMAVLDSDIDTYLKGERIMFHPEVESDPSAGLVADFGQRGDYGLVRDLEFNQIPYPNLNLSVPLTDPDAPNNAIRMEPGKGVITGVDSLRKEDLSLFRDWWPTDVDVSRNLHDMCSASGLYLVSVTVKADVPNTLTESDNPLMYVKIMTVDSINRNEPDSIVFILRERHFFDANHNLVIRPIEVLLGAIELRRTGFTPAVTFAVERPLGGPFPNPWLDTTLIRYERILDLDDRAFSDSISERRRGFDLRIHYGSGSNTFLLDAVCLSSPRVFGMLHADHETFNTTFPAYASVRNNFINHTDHLLRDGGTGILPGMRFLYGPEQGRHSSNWPVSSLAQVLLDSISGGAVSLYCASGYSEPTDVSGAFNRRFVSGFYAYPVTMSFAAHGRRPVYPGIDVNEYYDSLNQYAKRGFVDMARIYRKHAKQRQQVSTIKPWIPFVQNHTNLYLGDAGAGWNDGDWLREPTAAELRHQCNIALANDADGVMIYALVSAPSEFTINRWWPESRQQWLDDLNLHPQTGGDIDMNAGTMGYLDRNLARRRCDWNGENKWDLTAAYINNFLRPVADIIQEDLLWQDLKIWSIRGYPDAGENELVNEVLSIRQDGTDSFDPEDSTFVIVSEFEDTLTSNPYLFVLNGRTHPTEGHRHITIKLEPSDAELTQWMVTNVVTGDIWIVQPTSDPDNYSTANGFTDYLAPGEAGLYRLELVETPREHIPEILPGNIYVTPGANVSFTTINNHLFAPGKGISVEGYFTARGSTFGPSNETWMGIQARNDGSIYLTDCQVDASSVVAGSGGFVSVHGTRIDNAHYALCNLGGTLISVWTTAVNCIYGYAWLDGYYSSFDEDVASASYFSPVWSTGIDMHGTGSAYMHGNTLTDFGLGIVARAGLVSTQYTSPGRNKVDAVSTVLATDSLGFIDFGCTKTDNGSGNCFILQDYPNGYHAWGGGPQGIDAVGSYWEPKPLNLYGSVNADSTLDECHAPFTGGTGGRALTKSMSPPPGNTFRNLLAQAIADSNFTHARQLIAQRVSGQNRATLDLATVYTLQRAVSHYPDLGQLRDTLVLAFLLHPDIRFKLVAADLLAEISKFDDALDIIESYSFEGAPYLKREQLIRSALYRPFVYRGGYADGLRALDTLASIVGNDSTWLPLFALYPRLYSGLTPVIPDSSVPKTGERSSIMDRVLPDGIEVWPNYPNPFTDVTSFTFKLGEATHVRLAIYDAMGREVAVVTDADYDRGVHSAVLRAGALPSGLYFSRLTTDKGVTQRKMMLMR